MRSASLFQLTPRYFPPKLAATVSDPLQTLARHYVEQMDHAHLLQHGTPETEDVKVIGVYSSEASAKAAVERLRTQPGFRDYPDCFTIDAYELDKDHWVEGFVSG